MVKPHYNHHGLGGAAMMISGQKIRSFRESANMSQSELARKAGVKQPTIAAIESGEQKTARSLPKIASALGVDIWQLDPDYPMDRGRVLSFESSAVAYEVMLEFLRPDLAGADRQALSRVFLDLAQERLDGRVGGDLAAQLRLRVEFLVRPYRLK
jgi:transcriptional regulator with XRE-family HTH domain